MPRKPTTPGQIAKARELLQRLGPMSTSDLSRELGFSPGPFGRQLSMFGEELGLKKTAREIRKGKLIWIWDADPNWIPPRTTQGKPAELSPQQKAERESADRIAEMLRRFRQEPPRYAGGRQHV